MFTCTNFKPVNQGQASNRIETSLTDVSRDNFPTNFIDDL